MNREFWAMATGRMPADVRIDNVHVVDVFGGTVREGCVCFGQGRILGFSPLAAREVVDGGRRYLLPGLIDGHVHIESSMLCPARFAEMVLPFGTTTVMADPHEIANVKGMAGLSYMLEASRPLPLDVRIMLSSCVPALPVEDAGAVLSARDIAPLLADDKVGGLAEMMNVPGLLAGDADVLEKLEATLAAGKVIDGHAPLLSGAELDVYAALGVRTDHECTTVEELEARVSRGMYVLLREGTASRDLLKLLPGLTPENQRRCLFCTDDRQPADILRRGHIVNNVRMAVAAGIDPVSAVRMATLNAAECYGLRDRGGIAPGLRADLVLVEDLESFRVVACWAGGELVAREGRMLRALPQSDPGELGRSVVLAPLPERPFSVRVTSGKARIIGLLPHSLITECLVRPVATGPDGEVELSLNPGLVKIAVLERHHATGKIGVGLMEGRYGLRGGAIATTIAHDSHNIVVAGDDEDDMLLAVRELERMEGGIVMIAGGKVLAALPLPVGGLMSERPAAEVAAKLKELLEVASSHYHIWEGADAFMTLSFMALPVIPHFKITARGLFDVDSFCFVDVDAEK
ncbi:adenine deaminase [Mailhella massiliensis]|uniref:Adenine deaminase n=1 Tax=Mailhella massiliensis TaxID=1903261 RepID=A0A921AUD2_9BACT|nr:adenine deaminase [Mailhella massiliensis]HJD96308.1 adenine deaminase [Mailhella massiliensis]